jgi:SAM-dependent methyltransferase
VKDGSYGHFKGVWETPEIAEAYRDERFSRSRRWRWTDHRERRIVTRFLSVFPAGTRGLDIPCGAGRFFPVFREIGLHHVGADVSPAMVRLVPTLNGSRSALTADALSLPFAADSFNFILSIRLLHRIHDSTIRVRMLREMARVSRGPLLVTYYSRWNLRGIQRWLRGKHPGVSLSEVRRDADTAGLHVREAVPLRRWTQQQWFFVLDPISPFDKVVSRTPFDSPAHLSGPP